MLAAQHRQVLAPLYNVAFDDINLFCAFDPAGLFFVTAIVEDPAGTAFDPSTDEIRDALLEEAADFPNSPIGELIGPVPPGNGLVSVTNNFAVPTSAPTRRPTPSPTPSPTESPTLAPTRRPRPPPTPRPTPQPTKSPTDAPTRFPTQSPTDSPTNRPKPAPTPQPTASPTFAPVTVPQTPRPTPMPTPPPPPLCAGKCGEEGPQGDLQCYCDLICVSVGDCCPDTCSACEGIWCCQSPPLHCEAVGKEFISPPPPANAIHEEDWDSSGSTANIETVTPGRTNNSVALRVTQFSGTAFALEQRENGCGGTPFGEIARDPLQVVAVYFQIRPLGVDPTRSPTAAPTAAPTPSPTPTPTATPTAAPTRAPTPPPTPPPPPPNDNTCATSPPLSDAALAACLAEGASTGGPACPECASGGASCRCDLSCTVFNDCCCSSCAGLEASPGVDHICTGGTLPPVPVPPYGTPAPTKSPTDAPTASPTASPTESPTASPTGSPTPSPTPSPTAAPTAQPTVSPTGSPTAFPSCDTEPPLSPAAAFACGGVCPLCEAQRPGDPPEVCYCDDLCALTGDW